MAEKTGKGFVCGYKHHLKCGEKLGNCPTHQDEPLRCGPFYCEVCLLCKPELGRRCGICKQPVYACCC